METETSITCAFCYTCHVGVCHAVPICTKTADVPMTFSSNSATCSHLGCSNACRQQPTLRSQHGKDSCYFPCWRDSWQRGARWVGFLCIQQVAGHAPHSRWCLQGRLCNDAFKRIIAAKSVTTHKASTRLIVAVRKEYAFRALYNMCMSVFTSSRFTLRSVLAYTFVMNSP